MHKCGTLGLVYALRGCAHKPRCTRSSLERPPIMGLFLVGRTLPVRPVKKKKKKEVVAYEGPWRPLGWVLSSLGHWDLAAR